MTRRFVLARSELALLDRLLCAVTVAAFPFALYAGAWVISLMLWTSGPQLADLLWLIVACLLLAAWICHMALARGSVEIAASQLVVRHRRVLRRPLRIARSDVRAVALDEGWSGNARFPTTDPAEPFLWTGRRPVRRDRRRPLLGDAQLPNVALILDPPQVIRQARDPITALSTPRDPGPPSRRVPAEIIFLTLADTTDARAALAGWPLEDALTREALPDAVRQPARPAPEILAAFAVTAVVNLALLASGLWWLMPLVILAATPLVAHGVRHNQRRAARAFRAAGDDPHARAAAHANHPGAAPAPTWRSQPPPSA